MPNTPSSILASERRRALVASLLARNPRTTYRQIQAALAGPIDRGGIRNPETGQPYSLGTVHNDVKSLRKEWQESRTDSMDVWVGHELMTLQELEMQAWAANDLAEVRRVSESRRKLLGLDAPAKVAPTTPDGAAPYESGLIHVIEHFDPDDDKSEV